MRRARAVALLALVACVPKAPPVAAPPPASTADAVTWLDTPYSSAQLREAFPSGTVLVVARTGPDGATAHERWTFLDADADGVSVASELLSPDGRVIEDQGAARSTWEELRDHARFPTAQASRVRDTVETALGRFDAWRYTVVRPGDDGLPQHVTFWFADTLPGPPVRMTVAVADAVVATLEQVQRAPAGSR